jgi:hypothetical protein
MVSNGRDSWGSTRVRFSDCADGSERAVKGKNLAAFSAIFPASPLSWAEVRRPNHKRNGHVRVMAPRRNDVQTLQIL